jgi:hypothetical protein
VRYHTGWGTVCGLDVTCTGPDVDPCCGRGDGAGPAVYVNPGYAIDCCGNDLVVCDPMKVDLSSICVELPDPCADLPKEPVKRQSGGDNNIDKDRDQDEIDRLQAEIEIDPCLPWADRKNLFAVDLMLRYHEDLFQGQRTMFRSACGDAQPCGYARISERPCVHLEVVKDLSAPSGDGDVDAWQNEFRKAMLAYLKEVRQSIGNGDLSDVLRYVRRNPPSTLCFIEDYLCCLLAGDGKKLTDDWKELVAAWLLIDWMLRYLRCECASCKPDRGVKIGRVILRRFTVGGRARCRVVMIDTGPDNRRGLEKACRPIPPGGIDLGKYLWQPARAVRQQLAAQKVKVSEKVLRSKKAGDEFANLVVVAQPDHELYTVVMDDPLGVPRVAAFVRST